MPNTRRAVAKLVRDRPQFLICVTFTIGCSLVGAFSRDGWPCLIIGGLFGLGLTLNATAIVLNDGRMPARMSEIPQGQESKYCPMDRRTKMRILGDWIPFGARLMSPGDVFMLTGIAFPYLTFVGCLIIRRP